MALDGNILYVADTENHLLRRLDLQARTVTTIAGTGAQARSVNVPGTGTEVALNSPWDLVSSSARSCSLPWLARIRCG